ncbi:hypothetical protein Q3G72_009640 [Acer saccharum]|nr:hypothetical protein Q3G72_009640 [Acer saccharum]
MAPSTPALSRGVARGVPTSLGGAQLVRPRGREHAVGVDGDQGELDVLALGVHPLPHQREPAAQEAHLAGLGPHLGRAVRVLEHREDVVGAEALGLDDAEGVVGGVELTHGQAFQPKTTRMAAAPRYRKAMKPRAERRPLKKLEDGRGAWLFMREVNHAARRPVKRCRKSLGDRPVPGRSGTRQTSPAEAGRCSETQELLVETDVRVRAQVVGDPGEVEQEHRRSPGLGERGLEADEAGRGLEQTPVVGLAVAVEAKVGVDEFVGQGGEHLDRLVQFGRHEDLRDLVEGAEIALSGGGLTGAAPAGRDADVGDVEVGGGEQVEVTGRGRLPKRERRVRRASVEPPDGVLDEPGQVTAAAPLFGSDEPAAGVAVLLLGTAACGVTLYETSVLGRQPAALEEVQGVVCPENLGGVRLEHDLASATDDAMGGDLDLPDAEVGPREVVGDAPEPRGGLLGGGEPVGVVGVLDVLPVDPVGFGAGGDLVGDVGVQVEAVVAAADVRARGDVVELAGALGGVADAVDDGVARGDVDDGHGGSSLGLVRKR